MVLGESWALLSKTIIPRREARMNHYCNGMGVEILRRTRCCILKDEGLASAITIVVVYSCDGPVNWKLLKVGIAVTVNLRIQVRKDPTLEQRIVSKVDTANNVSGLKLESSTLASTLVIEWNFVILP